MAEKAVKAENFDASLDGIRHFTIASSEAIGLDSAHLASLRLSDLTADAANNGGAFKLAAFTAREIDGTAALPILARVANDPQGAGRELTSAFRVGKLSLTDADLRPPHGPHIQLAAAEGAQTRSPNGKRSGTFSITSLAVTPDPASLRPPQALALQRFGMSSFVFDLDSASAYDPEGHRTTLSRFDIIARGLGTLHLTGSITGNAFDGSPRTTQAAMDALRHAVLEKAMLRWDDASLTSRTLALVAAGKGTTPDALRAQLAVPLMGLSMVLPDQPDAAAQINSFLEHPKSLTITLNPPKPIALMDVGAAPVPQPTTGRP
jgi:hypothetical protein